MAQHIQDEGFHEIQLNGKQLVFLFMAATVVSVVIFLCGVLVGRGVRAQLGAPSDGTPVTNVAETTPTVPATPAPAPAAGSDPTAAAPPPPADDLSYFNRLEKSNAPVEKLKPASERPAAPAEKPTRRPRPRPRRLPSHRTYRLHPLRNRRCRHPLPFPFPLPPCRRSRRRRRLSPADPASRCRLPR